jgi:hypothetical protein
MRAVVASLLAVWMAILTVSGWCCHQPFCAHSQQATIVRADPPRACKCCHRQSKDTGPSIRLDDCCDDCQGTCTYVPSQRVQLEDGHALPASSFVVIVAQANYVGHSAFFGDRADDLACVKPPLRLHLLNQVLLI